ncbi:MAG: hypothetical protein IPJ34_16015 [Myxococcales bacterium]|nr:hypothetical protein [Myxococcales bacterium]
MRLLRAHAARVSAGAAPVLRGLPRQHVAQGREDHRRPRHGRVRRHQVRAHPRGRQDARPLEARARRRHPREPGRRAVPLERSEVGDARDRGAAEVSGHPGDRRHDGARGHRQVQGVPRHDQRAGLGLRHHAVRRRALALPERRAPVPELGVGRQLRDDRHPRRHLRHARPAVGADRGHAGRHLGEDPARRRSARGWWPRRDDQGDDRHLHAAARRVRAVGARRQGRPLGQHRPGRQAGRGVHRQPLLPAAAHARAGRRVHPPAEPLGVGPRQRVRRGAVRHAPQRPRPRGDPLPAGGRGRRDQAELRPRVHGRADHARPRSGGRFRRDRAVPRHEPGQRAPVRGGADDGHREPARRLAAGGHRARIRPVARRRGVRDHAAAGAVPLAVRVLHRSGLPDHQPRVHPGQVQGAFADVTVDCLGTISGWKKVGGDDRFEVAEVDLVRAGKGVGTCLNGRHTAESAGPFGIVVWGLDSYSSYAYPGGGNLASLSTVKVDPLPK